MAAAVVLEPDPRSLGHVPPQDLAAEQSVLGAMLLSKDAIAEVVEVLHGADFYRPAHESIFDAIVDRLADALEGTHGGLTMRSRVKTIARGQIRRLDEEEKAEERKLAADKLKKEQRDAKLGRLSADEQRKFLEKEREKKSKKGMKKSTVKA